MATTEEKTSTPTPTPGMPTVVERADVNVAPDGDGTLPLYVVCATLKSDQTLEVEVLSGNGRGLWAIEPYQTNDVVRGPVLVECFRTNRFRIAEASNGELHLECLGALHFRLLPVERGLSEEELLRLHVATLERQILLQRQAATEAERRRTEEIQQLRQTSDQLKQQRQAMETEIQRLQQQHQAATEAERRRTEEIQQLRQATTELQQQRQAMATEIQQLRQTTATATTERQQLRQMVTASEINLALANGWTGYGGSHGDQVQVTKIAGVVHFRGLVKHATPVSPGVIGNLPAGYRPRIIATFEQCTQDSTAARIDVYPDGSVKLVAGNLPHGWVSLSGINFVAHS